ncbi:MAG TPA: polysaccharide deacetylase family protein [Treponemataceae bacterium]|nr:polysaccharide deacetylase family protein [Treponemataceae bacterium]
MSLHLLRTSPLIACAVFAAPLLFAVACAGAASEDDFSADAPYVNSAVERSPVSNLALPALPDGTTAIPAPAGTDCDLTILNWAGFDGAASYSFDDGQPSHVAHWPELKATGVPMTFYLTPNMHTTSSDAAVAAWKDALSAGCELGNHTLRHDHYSAYTADTANADVADCATYIQTTLGGSASCSFAYPYGETNWKNNFGGRFLFARTINSGTVKPLDSTDPLGLPVFFVDAGQTNSAFNAALDKSASEKSWVIFLFHSLLPTDSNWYAGVQASDVTASIGHAKRGGNIWVDTVETVGSYWLAQKTLSAVVPTGNADAKTWTWSLPAGYPSGKYLRVTVSGGTLSQGGVDISWNPRGFYEVSLDNGSLNWRK